MEPNRLIEEVVVPALAALGKRVLRAEQESDTVYVHETLSLQDDPGCAPREVQIRATAYEASHCVIFTATLPVPAQRSGDLALFAARELHRFVNWTTWRLEGELLLADLTIPLAIAEDEQAAVAWGYQTLLGALLNHFGQVLAVAYPPPQTRRTGKSKVEKQVDQIVRRTGF